MNGLQKHYSPGNTENRNAIYFELEDDKHGLKNHWPTSPTDSDQIDKAPAIGTCLRQIED